MNLFYTCIFTLALPFILLRLIWRGCRTPAYFSRWNERFGLGTTLPDNKPIIWLHTVSFGEVEASRPIIKVLQEEYPAHELLITTMTPTGSARVKSLFSDTVAHCYLPYDIPFAIRFFLKRKHPAFGIILETEIWPNLLTICHQQNIPMVLANARMSERSSKGYQRFPSFISHTLQKFSLIAAQSEADKARFHHLGADIKKIHAVGNLKYEISLPASLKEQAESMRVIWDINRPVWVVASTHEGEEEMVLNACRQIRAKFPKLLVIIAPRHPERFDKVCALSQRSGNKTLRRSEHLPCSSDVQVLLLDTMGELPLFYAASDLALIGGSLVPHGSHNLLEPGILGCPILTGPHYFNFHEVTELFLQSGAAIKVADPASIALAVIDLLQNPQKRAEIGDAALKNIANSQGASQRLLNLIKRHAYK